MLKQLEIEALQADLEAVRERLAARTRRQDPIGFKQFTARQAEIERRLNALNERVSTRKEVGLFFGGTPVVGSRGIDAGFASRAIESFQHVVTAKFASIEGPVGQRGRIRGSHRAQMLIADVARGSFGFVLEQASNDAEDEAGLGETITEVVEYIHSTYSDTDEQFELIARGFDRRLLQSMKEFFRLLHSSGATLRVVSDEQQFLLEHSDIERARLRVDKVKTVDETRPFQGRLLFTPSSRRFDLFLGGGTVLSGTISNVLMPDIMTEGGMPKDGIADTWCVVELRVRKVTIRGQSPTESYQLIRIISSGAKGPHDIFS